MLSEGGGSCTNSTSYAVGSWVGNGTNFTIVDTPGFQDSDEVRIFFPGTDHKKKYIQRIVMLRSNSGLLIGQ